MSLSYRASRREVWLITLQELRPTTRCLHHLPIEMQLWLYSESSLVALDVDVMESVNSANGSFWLRLVIIPV